MLGSIFIVGVPAESFAAGECNSSILGLPAWYNNLNFDANCGVIMPEGEDSGALTAFIGTIIGNVVQDLLLAAAYVCVGLIIYAGYLFTTSSGNYAAVEKAKKTISGAIIGMIICLLAFAIVNAVISVLFIS